MDFLTLLAQYMDGYAVLIGIGLTQVVKYLLPNAPGSNDSTTVSSFWNRLLPFFPLVFAIATVLVRDTFVTSGHAKLPLDDALIKGLTSGFAAAYLYRTAKVTLFGE